MVLSDRVGNMSNVTTNIQLGLPKLNLSGAKESSNTPVSKLIGFYENVHFVPWNDFHDVISDARKVMRKVDVDELESAGFQLKEARRSINEVDFGSQASQGDQLDSRKRFSSCTSVDPIHNIVFTFVVRRLLRGMHTENLHIETKQFVINSGCHIVPVASTKPTPDKALLRYNNGELSGKPICTYELKGPKLNLTAPALGIASDLRRKSRERKDENGDTEPASALDEGQTSVHETPQCPHEVSARVMCDFFNVLFGTLNHYSRSSIDSPHVTLQIMKPLAQTLIQGMTTKSGCCFLYTHEIGIAFEMTHLDEEDRIVIRVSPLLCCENENGAISGIIALSHYSIKKVDEDEGAPDKVKKFYEKIDASAREREESDQKDVRGYNFEGASGSGRRKGQFSGQKRRRKNDGATQSMTMSEGSFVTAATECNIIEEALKDMLYQKHRVLARGRCGIILEGIWERKRAAIKLWNGEENSELDSLRAEIEFYTYIEDNYPSILGVAVPKLLLGWNQKNGDVVLITEYVGQDVARGRDGKLFVGGNCLSTEETEELRSAAAKSLRAIHESGVLHGDVALRNL